MELVGAVLVGMALAVPVVLLGYWLAVRIIESDDDRETGPLWLAGIALGIGLVLLGRAIVDWSRG